MHREYDAGAIADRIENFSDRILVDAARERVPPVKQIGMTMAAGIPMLAAAAALTAGPAMLARRRQRKGFENMIEQNPHLKEEDPLAVRQAYQTMQSFAPSMSQDPHAAGSFVSKAL